MDQGSSTSSPSLSEQSKNKAVFLDCSKSDGEIVEELRSMELHRLTPELMPNLKCEYLMLCLKFKSWMASDFYILYSNLKWPMAAAQAPADVSPWTGALQLSHRPFRSNTRIKPPPSTPPPQEQPGQLHMEPWAQASVLFFFHVKFRVCYFFWNIARALVNLIYQMFG